MANRGVLIDTSTLVRHFRETGDSLTRFERAIAHYGNCYISAISVFEVEFGALRAGRQTDLQNILKLVQVLPFGQDEAQHASHIHAELVAENQVIGIRDVFIAGTCRAHQLPVLTENEAHFRRVKGLSLVEL